MSKSNPKFARTHVAQCCSVRSVRANNLRFVKSTAVIPQTKSAAYRLPDSLLNRPICVVQAARNNGDYDNP